MQIRTTPVMTQNIPKNNQYVYFCDTAALVNDYKEYYANLRGVIASFFDKPSKIHDRVLVKYDKKHLIVMRFCDFIAHLILWRANVIFKIPITEIDFYNLKVTDPNSLHINTVLNMIVERLIEHEGQLTDPICECIYKIKDKFSELLHGYSAIRCNTISVYDIIQFKNRNQEFNKLINTSLDETKSIKELENEMKDNERRLIKVIKEDPYNCFNPYLFSKRINSGQLTKVLVAVGTRPDIDKTILPKPIKRGYIHGLQDAAEYFMETVTARDAMLTKVDNIPLSGLLSREVNRLTSNIYINYNIDDCGTHHTLSYEVKNEDYLDMIIDKYYYDERNQLKAVRKTDTHLIGKTIRMRSSICCASKHGVCKTCVGEVHKRLIGTRLGCLPPIKAVNTLSKKTMAGKHDATTKSIEIVNETLTKYFHNNGADFYINPEYADSRQFYIVINQDDVEELLNSSALDLEDDTVDTSVQLSYAAIRDKGTDYLLENEGMRIILSDETISQNQYFIDDPDDSDYVLIPINKLDPSSPVFSVIQDTEEISKYLNQFINIVDRKSVAKFQTYDNLISEMNRICYDAGFINEIIHFESIVHGMVRSVDDITVRPDFTKDDVDYQMLRISSSIEKKDLYTTLSFQGLRRLFKDSTIRKRFGVSVYDNFFKVSPLY
jgi:hypothetical protein